MKALKVREIDLHYCCRDTGEISKKLIKLKMERRKVQRAEKVMIQVILTAVTELQEEQQYIKKKQEELLKRQGVYKRSRRTWWSFYKPSWKLADIKAQNENARKRKQENALNAEKWVTLQGIVG